MVVRRKIEVSPHGTCHVDVYKLKEPKGIAIFGHSSLSKARFYTCMGNAFPLEGYEAWVYSTPNILKNDPRIWRDCVVAIIRENLGRGNIVVSGHSTGAVGAGLAAEYSKAITHMILMEPGYPDERDESALDDRIRNMATHFYMPVQFQYGSLSKIVEPWRVKKHFEKVPHRKRSLICHEGGNHAGFLDPGPWYWVANLVDNKPTMSHDKQLADSIYEIWQFLGSYP